MEEDRGKRRKRKSFILFHIVWVVSARPVIPCLFAGYVVRPYWFSVFTLCLCPVVCSITYLNVALAEK
jgi:hypothetical protein